MFKRRTTVGLSVFLLLLFSLQGIVFANDEDKSLEEQLDEWYEQGIDPNHSEVIEKIQVYIDEHISNDQFGGLYIDRDDRPLGIITLLFTEMIDDQQRRQIEGLVMEPAEVAFREVSYSEKELQQKQDEINQKMGALTNEGVTVMHTFVDLFENRVEVGIDPYNEDTVQLVLDTYGEDMLHVTEGFYVQLEGTDDQPSALELEPAPAQDDLNFLQRFFKAISSWVSSLFS